MYYHGYRAEAVCSWHAQVAEARRELEERLGPDKLAFLRSRGRSKPGPAPSGVAGASSALPAQRAQQKVKP